MSIMFTLIVILYSDAMIQVGDYRDLQSCQNAAKTFVTEMAKDSNKGYAYCIPAPDER